MSKLKTSNATFSVIFQFVDFCPQCCLTFIRLTYFFSRVMKRAFAAASVARDGNACTCSKRKQAYTRKGAFPPHFFGAKFAKNLQGTKRGRRRQSRRCKWTLSAELDNINQTRPGKMKGCLEMNFILFLARKLKELDKPEKFPQVPKIQKYRKLQKPCSISF